VLAPLPGLRAHGRARAVADGVAAAGARRAALALDDRSVVAAGRRRRWGRAARRRARVLVVAFDVGVEQQLTAGHRSAWGGGAVAERWREGRRAERGVGAVGMED